MTTKVRKNHLKNQKNKEANQQRPTTLLAENGIEWEKADPEEDLLYDNLTIDDTPAADNVPIVEVSLEELDEERQIAIRELGIDSDGPSDTQNTDGSTYYPSIAEEQGLVYIPPDDPPVLPSDGSQGIEMGAGFGKSLEEEGAEAERLPARLRTADLELEEEIKAVLRKSSETSQLDDIEVRVEDGIVYLTGTVETLEDIDIVVALVQDIEGVVDVEEEFTVAEL